MANDDEKKPSIFRKMLDAGSAVLDQQIRKAQADVNSQSAENVEDFVYSKAITEDPTYSIHSSGWKDKPHRLQNGHLKQMSLKDSVIAAIIQTRQNQISNYSKFTETDSEKGWKLKLRNEDEVLQKIKEDLKKEMGTEDKSAEMQKAEGDAPESDVAQGAKADTEDNNESDDSTESYNWELERRAREKLEEQYKKKKEEIKEYLLNCGVVEDRPFESRKWNFDRALRAWVRDSLTYDLHATEIVPQRDGNPHHWFPIDGATVKIASNRLKDYKRNKENMYNLDILYPEKQVKKMEDSRILELDEEKLENDEYRWVQVIRGNIERAFTERELKVGVRNPTTDIYNNGYGVSELELAVSLISGHLNAEFYNQSYFTQGFSAKGILHIKAGLNRRKLESVRQQWQHMLRGARNSFQTPIFAGVEDVEWIPLTQNHDDIGFEGWMRYLIRMMCAIYQIDPAEIGVNLKDEGGSSGMSGDNTSEKINQSKDRGLYPMLRHFETHINECILKPFNEEFILCFTGVDAETKQEALERQAQEAKFKKTVNELRAEDGLPPLPGMDDFIPGPEYTQWYMKFSEKAEKQMEQMQQQQMDQFGAMPDDGSGMPDMEEPANPADDAQNEFDSVTKSFRKKPRKVKTVQIEYIKEE